MSEPVRKVSKKKILFVNLEEEISHIFEKISVLPYKEIYLVVPQRAALLQSVVNLKILKQKLEDIDKELNLITKDPVGMKLAHQADIKVYDQWSVESYTRHEDDEPEHDDAKKIHSFVSPIPASTNDTKDYVPSRLPQKKSSIFEIVKKVKHEESANPLMQTLDFIKNKYNDLKKDSFILPSAVNKKFLSALIVGSCSVLFIIAYVALPGATISIEPASSVVRKSINVVLSEVPNDANELMSFEVETSVKTSIKYKASGSKSEGFRSSGKLTIVNKTTASRPLIAQTRFQTEDGLVFRLQEDVIVPAGSEKNPAKLEVYVVADDKDANGLQIGERGNISPSKFFLPALSEATKTKVYAESYTAMTGGANNSTPLILEEDLIAGREKLEKELKDKAIASLRKEAIAYGQEAQLNLKLIESSDVLKFEEADIDIPYDLVGKEQLEFEITGSIKASGFAYDYESLLNMLKNSIKESETPGKKLIRIDEESVSIEIINIVGQNSSPIKFTANIQGVEEYEVDAKKEDGLMFTKKIKEHIAGKTVEEAEAYLQNLPEVNRVEIKMWPRWSPSIPNLPDNIKIKNLSTSKEIE